MKRVLIRGLLALGCCNPAWAQQPSPAISAEQLAATAWRVCISDLVVPPLLTGDPARPGIMERLLVDAGAAAGLRVKLLAYPARRCSALLQHGDVDAAVAAPIASNLAQYGFPMKGGAVDASRYLVRTQLVWVKRRDSAYDWDGRRLTDTVGAVTTPVVGVRFGVGAARDAVAALGLPVDDRALNTRQLLAKLLARRIELAVVLQGEFTQLMPLPEFAPLTLLAKPLQTQTYYAVLSAAPSPAQRLVAESWWGEIARLRDLPAYRP